MTVKRTVVLAIAAFAITTITAPSASAATCTSTTMPLPADLPYGHVTAADSGGGYAGDGYLVEGFGTRGRVMRWSNGQLTDLGTLPNDSNPHVAGVNRQGTVVGWSPVLRAFHSRNGKLEALPIPAGARGARAEDINDNGDIVGTVVNDLPSSGRSVYTPVLWPADGSGPVKLTGLPTAGHAEAKAIDQDGTVLIEYYPTLQATSATALYLWKAGTARKLTIPAGTTSVRGNDVSNGRVVGETYLPSSGPQSKGALWDKDGTLSSPADSYYLKSINSSGVSVGWTRSTPGSRAVWNLSTLTTTLPDATSLDVSADNGTFGGSVVGAPTVWRCG
jgi:hypothetical protein